MALIDDIAGLVSDGLIGAGMSKPAVLIKVTSGTRTPGAQSAGVNPTEASFAAAGFVKTTTLDKINGELVQKTDRVVCLLGASIASGQIPTSQDKITIEGVTTRIVAVDRDAASALYTCLTRA